MANYVKTTDFAAKDSLLTGNPAKIVKGTEIDTEFNDIATAIASKLDSTGAVLTTQINDTTADHQYVFAVSELAADRTVTLPLLTGNDEFVFKDHAVTFTNKTVSLGSNTVTGTKAQFNSACSDGDFLFSGDVSSSTISSSITLSVNTTDDNITAAANYHYVLGKGTLQNVNLPDSAGLSGGEIIIVTVANDLSTNTITPNGTDQLNGLAEAMTLDNAYASVWVRWTDSTRDWRVL